MQVYGILLNSNSDHKILHTERQNGLEALGIRISPASIVQRRIIEPGLINHLPHVSSISNSPTNCGDVSFQTSIEYKDLVDIFVRGAPVGVRSQAKEHFRSVHIATAHA